MQEITLQEIEARIWADLLEASSTAKHPYHTCSLTTARGAVPSTRTVVLRAVDPEGKRLRCHTDARSPKIVEAQGLPVCWHFYAPELKVQLRLTGVAAVHHQDPIAQAVWDTTPLTSRRCYLVTEAPGAPLPAPGSALPQHLLDRVPTWEESTPGYANFAVIWSQIRHLDWLYLAATGHRRAGFDYHNGSLTGSTWLVP